MQPVGDVLAHGEGIEERALLEDHADPAAQVEQVLFLHLGDVVAEDPDAAAVRLEQAERQFQDGALAGAGHAQQHLGFAVTQQEGNAVEHDVLVEGDGHVVEDDGVLGFVIRWRAGQG